MAKHFEGIEGKLGSAKGQNQGSGLKIKGGKWGGSKAAENLNPGSKKGGPKMGPVKA